MIKLKVDIGDLTRQLHKFGTEAGQVIAGIAIDEFTSLLHNTPQWSGNYVANMKLVAGDRASGGFTEYFPRSPFPVFIRGNLPAINTAKGNAAGFKKKASGRVMSGRGGWSGPSIFIFNPTSYAEIVETGGPFPWGGAPLRGPNLPGELAVTLAIDRLRAAYSQGLVPGSMRWHYYKNLDL